MVEDRYFQTIRQLAEYEVWCNDRAIAAAEKLDAADLFRDFGFGLRTIHATLFHTVEVFQRWSGCIGPAKGKPVGVPYDKAMTVDEIARWNTSLSELFLEAVGASHAAGLLHLDRRIVQVFHLVTHGTHHRTQFITMLRLLGVDPPYEAGDFGGWSRGRQPT